ncbi:MAG: Rrf2 family transcriptional regulator, partial [Anaerotignaceae bacterium]
GDILRVTEGNLAPVACLEDRENKCPRYAECAAVDFWSGLHNVVNAYIEKFTLKDLMDEKDKSLIS